MCGIFGNVRWHGTVDEHELRIMGEQLHHRGPDEAGTYVDRHVGFGSRRLSIVDLAGGGQPFRSENGAVVLVCNGEIFNYRQLRSQLEGRHRFRSNCDVEVIAHLYEERGIALLDELNGQFAFALHDRRRNTVFLARDHFGICPLHYREGAGGTLFASEAKAILACPGVPSELDLAGLDQVLSLPALVSPRTMFEGVKSVRPGHYVELTPDGLQEHEYWDLVYLPAEDVQDTGTAEDYREEIVHTLRNAVHRRLQADVPIGLYVSGGLDSALVASLAAEVHDPHVTHLLSVGFGDVELDETQYQRLVADRLGLPHHHIDVTVDDVCRRLELTVWQSETPLRESYNVASFELAAAAQRAGVKVVLSGEGADELFAGYSGYRFDALRAEIGGLADPAAGELEARAALWGDSSYGYDLNFAALHRERRRLYSSDLRAALPDLSDAWPPLVDGEKLRGRCLMHKRSYLDVKLRLAEHLLGDHGDRMTMANSIEGRYPFLDLEFVRLAMSIPPRLKLHELEEKYVLKEAAAGVVPDQVARREKFPFTAQGSPYLVQRAPEFVGDWLSPSVLRRQNLFDPNEVARMRRVYSNPVYRCQTPLRTDWLMIVLTSTILHDFVTQRTVRPEPCLAKNSLE
jgi:asparagine synthase (glutamine-hydrolysing)